MSNLYHNTAHFCSEQCLLPLCASSLLTSAHLPGLTSTHVVLGAKQKSVLSRCSACMVTVLPHPLWHKPDSCSRSSCRTFPGPHRSHCASVAAKLSIQVACQNTVPGSWLGTSQQEHYGVSGGRGADRCVCWLVCRRCFCSFPVHPGARHFPLLPGTAPGGSHHSWPRLTAIIPAAPLTIKEEIKQLEYLGFKY